MKISLIGYGKTGKAVARRLADDPVARAGTVFDTSNPATAEAIKASGSDAVVIFVPGAAAAELMDPVLESGCPAVWGSTGAAWPDDLHERLVRRGVSWVVSPNFSIGMAWIRHCLAWFQEGGGFPDSYRLSIHEIHHTAKLDRPSGTALDWRDRITAGDSPYRTDVIDMSSDRIADEPGRHVLTIDGPGERMQLIHQAKDRSVFADGAILAARWLASAAREPGLHTFDEVIAATRSDSDPLQAVPTSFDSTPTI